jgi:hypothetical protein
MASRPAGFAKLGAPDEHCVGSFGGFDSNHVASDHDGGLSDIEAAECADHFESHIDVGLILRRRRHFAERAVSGQKIGRHIACPVHPIPLLFEETDDSRQHVIVTAFAEAKKKGQGLKGAEIEFDIGEIRPVHATDYDKIAAAILFEGREHLADLTPFDPGVRKSLDLLPRLATNGDNVQRKSPRRCRLCQHARKRTSSGDNPKRACYLARFRSGPTPTFIGQAVRHCSVRRIGGPIAF